MKSADVISTLNDLIETCKDGAENFKACVEDTNNQQTKLKMLFGDRQRSYAAAASELQNLVRDEGVEPLPGSNICAAMHRSWIDITATIAGKNNETVLNECERAEESALESYRKALSKNLPGNIRMVVERQCQRVLHNYDQIKILRDQI